jgi:hypothetical protein
LAADGYCVYTLVNSRTGRAEAIPEDITAKYSI